MRERSSDSVRARVRVWVARLDEEPPTPAALAAVLTDEERHRAAAIASAVQRRRFVVGRGVLRALLAAAMRCPPQEVAIVRPGHGKPTVVGRAGAAGRPPQFNVSHSEGLLVVAIGADTGVGVDIERLRRLRDPEALAARVLAPEERAAFDGAPDRDAALLERWTGKEAVLKGLGDGLAGDPAAVVVDAVGPDPRARAVRIGGVGSPWHVRSLTPAPGYVGAVAAPCPGFSLQVRSWTAP
ncbi:MAG: 4'-phosphopantetheinyl transferase superfamily protein [Egibacteraceae bacterium]